MKNMKVERDLLKQLHEKEEQKYQALKKHTNEFEARFVKLQQNNSSLKHIVKEQDIKILKLKHEIQIVVQLKNEAILEQIKVNATNQSKIDNMMLSGYEQLWTH